MRLSPLHPDFGVEVHDFDVEGPTAPAEIEALRAALDEHQLLLIRPGRGISPERQVEIIGWFGPPMDNGGSAWSTLDNHERAGSDRLPFHSDLSYTDAPIKVISLHALELPAGGSETAYVSSATAWSALQPNRQAWLAPLTLRHRHTSQIAEGRPEFAADHPLRLTHPRTGDPILYVTEYHADRIHELDAAESEATLAELRGHIYAPERVYTHAWRRHDLLIWDNLSVQHSRPQPAELAAGARVLQRAAVSEVSFAEAVARAQRRPEPRPTV